MTGHRSPPGTWEPILKSVLEDPALSDRAYRLGTYLATKPDGWEIRPAQLAAALERTPNWVKGALAELRRRGLVVIEDERKPGGALVRRVSRLDRALVVAPVQTSRSELASENPSASHDQAKRRVVAGQHLRAGNLAASNPAAIEKTVRPEMTVSSDGPLRGPGPGTEVTPTGGSQPAAVTPAVTPPEAEAGVTDQDHRAPAAPSEGNHNFPEVQGLQAGESASWSQLPDLTLSPAEALGSDEGRLSADVGEDVPAGHGGRLAGSAALRLVQLDERRRRIEAEDAAADDAWSADPFWQHRVTA